MSRLLLITADRQRDRERALMEWLAQYAHPASRRLDALLLAPSRRRGEALKSAVDRFFNGRVWSPKVMTVDSFLRERALSMPSRRRWISEGARTSLAQKLIQQRRLFDGEPATRNFARQALDMLYDMSEEAPFQDLSLFADVYDQTLERLGYWDSRSAAAHIGTDAPVRARALVLDEFTRLRALDRSLIQSLLPFFEAAAATLPLSRETEELRLWHLDLGAEELEAPSGKKSLTQRVGAAVFQQNARVEASDGNGRFRVLSCASRRNEARTAARLIRLALGNVSPDEADFNRFAVAAPSLPLYRDLAASEFASYGLPTRFGRGAPLLQFAAIRFAHTLLERIALKLGGDGFSEQWDIEDLSEVLTRAEIAHSEDISPAASRLLGGAVKMSARPSRFYMRRISQQARAAGLYIAPFNADEWMDAVKLSLTDAPRDENDFFEQQESISQEKLLRLAFDLSEIERFVEKAQAFSDAKTPEDARAALRRLFQDYGLPANAPKERSAWSAFNNLMDEAVRVFRSVEGEEFEAGAYADFLAQSLADASRTIDSAQPMNAVSVLSFREAAGLSFDTLFILGLAEGEAPAPSNVHRFSERISAPLSDRFFFQQTLLNSDSAVLTYPRRERGKRMEPSPFIDDALALFEEAEDEIDPLQEHEYAALLCARDALIAMGGQANAENHERLRLPHSNAPRLIEQERLRQSRKEWSVHDGHVTQNRTALELLRKIALEPYSAYRLEMYASCPMRYFFASVLRLQDADQDDSDVAPIIYGKLIHQILESFFRSWQGTAENLDDEAKKRLRKTLYDHAREKARPYDARYRNLYWQERRRDLLSGLTDKDEPKGVLRLFIDAEMDGSEFAFGAHFDRGYLVEKTFGEMPGLPELQAFPHVAIEREDMEEPIQTRGVIDRIDLNKETGEFTVYDYKTGRLPRARLTLEGLHFQLPLYMMAASGHKGCERPVGGAYYSAGDPRDAGKQEPVGALLEGASSRRSGMMQSNEFSGLLQFTRKRIAEIDAHIRAGRFHPTIIKPIDAGCAYCQFKEICRVDETRQSGMPEELPAYRPKPFGGDEENGG
ncbi:MAG: PD-(D/E)XK nuclease family protein [Candidatus Poribacteria bacterium]|nr:PD-(D/E)XK nuclease family protein [Candidatus Poribacteria bacterium]